MRAILEIPEDLYQALSERSAREGRSASGLAAEILRDSLELPAPAANEDVLAQLEAQWREGGGRSSGRAWTREGLYDRPVLR